VTIERFQISRNVTALAIGKSTYARCGLMPTRLRLKPTGAAGLWSSSTTPRTWPVRLYAEEGFIQILFFESDEECERATAIGEGISGQQGLTLAKL